jgi:phosphatidylserine/phosphatidylglycerophosphate/cardiolipin synthase-like enzyme
MGGVPENGSTDVFVKSFGQVFWGGPDCSPRALRDLLKSRIKAVPPGGEIRWITYYFRDEELANDLAEARRRGVLVWVTLEKKPRTAPANQGVAGILGGPRGLADGFRQIMHRVPDNFYFKRPCLHEKLYFFSHPHPHALVGSFNPSTNRPEDPLIIAEIGDQDQEHNFLVEFNDASMVSALKAHMHHIHNCIHGPWERMFSPDNRIIRSKDTCIYLFPRRRRGILKKYLNSVPPGSILRIAISHMNNAPMANLICSLHEKGVIVEIIAHATGRRVPLWIEQELTQAKISFHRYRHPQGTSMHQKFILLENDNIKQVIFGSMNLSSRSLHANHELLVISENPCLFEKFRRRWEKMVMDINAFSGATVFS